MKTIIKKGFNSLMKNTKKINRKTNKNEFLIIMDILLCKLLYGSNPVDYYEFSFYELDKKKRSTYVTRGLEMRLRKMNDKSYTHIFDNKGFFLEKFSNFTQREWILTKDLSMEEFESFLENKDCFILKPIDAQEGRGIKKINVSSYESIQDIYDYIIKKEAVLEEWIVQHKDISKLYNKSINPLRVVTFNKKGQCYILGARLTIGSKGDIANASLNDMMSPVDLDTGKLKYSAADEIGNVYIKHPITNVDIKGTKIPYWNEILLLVEHASKIIPEVPYIGWDIAITPKGPVIIEGNTAPGYRTTQYKVHLPNRIGQRKIYEKVLK